MDTETLPQHLPTATCCGTARAIPARGLSEEDCRKFGYLVGQKANGDQVQIAVQRQEWPCRGAEAARQGQVVPDDRRLART